jgi:hypothetical protein
LIEGQEFVEAFLLTFSYDQVKGWIIFLTHFNPIDVLGDGDSILLLNKDGYVPISLKFAPKSPIRDVLLIIIRIFPPFFEDSTSLLCGVINSLHSNFTEVDPSIFRSVHDVLAVGLEWRIVIKERNRFLRSSFMWRSSPLTSTARCPMARTTHLASTTKRNFASWLLGALRWRNDFHFFNFIQI